METKKTGKRIVSKGEYISLLGKKGVISTVGLLLVLFSLLSYLLMFVSMAAGRGNAEAERRRNPLVVTFGVGMLLFGYAGFQTIKRAKRIDIGVPLTRTNSADLLAEDSLVRASAEPIQEQQAVLLRAAQGQETPAEESGETHHRAINHKP